MEVVLLFAFPQPITRNLIKQLKGLQESLSSPTLQHKLKEFPFSDSTQAALKCRTTQRNFPRLLPEWRRSHPQWISLFLAQKPPIANGTEAVRAYMDTLIHL